MTLDRRFVPVVLLGLAAAACDSTAPAAAARPAVAEPIAHESELLRLTLSEAAERQLGIAVAAVDDGSLPAVLVVHGEIVAAPARGGLPIGAAPDFAALAANQARADGEVGRLTAEREVARIAYERAEQLVREEAGSLRQRDEARAALGAADANLAAARAQRALLGPAVAGLGDAPARWVRAAAIVGDLPRIDRTAAAAVTDLAATGPRIRVVPVAGPPSANYGAATVDLFYRVTDAAARLRVGERVRVELPVAGGRSTGLVVPSAAILRDSYGGEWVYARTGERQYERRRVEVAASAGDRVLLRRGPPAGTAVVTAGAMELFGTEFGAK